MWPLGHGVNALQCCIGNVLALAVVLPVGQLLHTLQLGGQGGGGGQHPPTEAAQGCVWSVWSVWLLEEVVVRTRVCTDIQAQVMVACGLVCEHQGC